VLFSECCGNSSTTYLNVFKFSASTSHVFIMLREADKTTEPTETQCRIRSIFSDTHRVITILFQTEQSIMHFNAFHLVLYNIGFNVLILLLKFLFSGFSNRPKLIFLKGTRQ
jgi:hypothetical protein